MTEVSLESFTMRPCTVGVRIALLRVMGSGMSVERWRLRLYRFIRVVHLAFPLIGRANPFLSRRKVPIPA